MGLHLKIVRTYNFDPWRNLAVEEYLLNTVKKNECILYLWQNQNTVVIGKNQNPWKECRNELLEKEGGKLARRISGGGAVFHDTGNLNFSFLVDRSGFDVTKQLEVILLAVRDMGINASFSGRNDLTVDQRKFSGNAFCYRKTAALHHGTILVSVDMEKLTRYLQVSREKIKSKGVESVRARVVNLSEYNPSLNIEKMVGAVTRAFNKVYEGDAPIVLGEQGMDKDAIDRLYQKYSSWEWRYGESPKFDIDLSTRFQWGGVELGLQLEQGRIKKAYVYSDAMDEAFIERIPKVLEGCPFHSADMVKALKGLEQEGERKTMVLDIAQWLQAKGF